MPGYIVVQVNVQDQAKYDEYRKLVPASLEAYGGKFVIRGGKVEILEGDWSPKRLVILEFESVERAKQWWASEEYKDAKRIRQLSATAQMIVVEGV